MQIDDQLSTRRPHPTQPRRTHPRTLQKQFTQLWLARNKPSRLADITSEFQRLAAEYKHFA